MKTIISFSGGLDSTYLLWKLLTETEDEITAVLISTDTIEGNAPLKYDLRAFLGSDSANAIAAAEWLNANVRPFTFINQNFDTSFVVQGYGNPNSPPTYLARYVTPLINNGTYDRFVLCNEKENDGYSNGGTVSNRAPGSLAAREIFISGATRGSIQFPLIEANYTQAVALSSIPQDLLEIIDVCVDSPTRFKCQKKQWFQNLLGQGKTTEEIWSIYYGACTVVPNKWFSMKFWLNNQQATDQNTWEMPQWPSSYEVS